MFSRELVKAFRKAYRPYELGTSSFLVSTKQKVEIIKEFKKLPSAHFERYGNQIVIDYEDSRYNFSFTKTEGRKYWLDATILPLGSEWLRLILSHLA